MSVRYLVRVVADTINVVLLPSADDADDGDVALLIIVSDSSTAV